MLLLTDLSVIPMRAVHTVASYFCQISQIWKYYIISHRFVCTLGRFAWQQKMCRARNPSPGWVLSSASYLDACHRFVEYHFTFWIFQSVLIHHSTQLMWCWHAQTMVPVIQNKTLAFLVRINQWDIKLYNYAKMLLAAKVPLQATERAFLRRPYQRLNR